MPDGKFSTQPVESNSAVGPLAGTANGLDQAGASLTQALLWPPITSGLPQSEPQPERSVERTSSSVVERSHVCIAEGCNKSYVRNGDLSRHEKNVHEHPSAFRCHFHRCTRGISGRGFSRKDKFVDHLKSRYHGLSHKDARYEAEWHNRPQLTPDGGWRYTFHREHDDGCIESN